MVSVLTTPELSWSTPTSHMLFKLVTKKSQASLSALDVFLQAQKISAWFAVSAAALVATTTSGRLWDVLSLRVKSDIDIIFIYKR